MALRATNVVTPDEDDAPQIRWSVVFLTFTVLGLLRFSTFYLDDLTRSQSGTFGTRLLEEITGAYGALLLFPIVVALEREGARAGMMVAWYDMPDDDGSHVVAAAVVHIDDLDREIAFLGQSARHIGKLRMQPREAIRLVVERNHDGKPGFHASSYILLESRIELVARGQSPC